MGVLEGDATAIIGFVAAIILASSVGGLLAGLLGVGGGIIIVPVLYQLLALFDVEPGLRMKVAVATSLATIIATSAVSVRSHYRRGAIDTDLLKSWGVPIFIGVVLGTALGGYADGRLMTAVFAAVALVVSLRMFLVGDDAKPRDGFPNTAVKSGFGLFVGGISALMGIGGGTLSVPILTAYGFDIRRAVGTAAAIGFIIAIPGTLGYIYTGLGQSDLPPFSLGYLNLAALLAFIPLTMAMAPVGARIAHTIPRKRLQLCFAIFLGITSLRMFYDLYKSIWL
ncbi:sulfite exporter TauE/SafE family protein [Aureimonas fodinaquatilis]|uniref:Probable membrane transporter protein n=1 Tax=Aureimonas fodinaquatilis TaxID=2565783 RepID=A0A5B0DUX4_9HYPH|nr:sulfite exporter TauE/SafE family protein [Aureimonas fodinaquatilis]KAA0969591.1 sulfite exporter TauE/SafE family protein [Aureimonas fodinaquatilis]